MTIPTVFNAPREHSLSNKTPVSISQKSPLIDQKVLFIECGDSLDAIFVNQCTCKSCAEKLCKRKKKRSELQKSKRLKSAIGRFPFVMMMMTMGLYIAITPVLSTEEPVNSLIMENEHLDTISATESDEFIKSSVEILVPIPSESKGVPKVCDVPFHDNSPPLDISKDQSEDFSDSNVDSTSIDEDSFLSNDVEYVRHHLQFCKPVSSKVMEIVYSKVG
ncbi:hypothetical protein Tco_0313718 [Tanacetum coccineum]